MPKIDPSLCESFDLGGHVHVIPIVVVMEIERLRKVETAAIAVLAALHHAKANMPHPDQMIDDAIALATA